MDSQEENVGEAHILCSAMVLFIFSDQGGRTCPKTFFPHVRHRVVPADLGGCIFGVKALSPASEKAFEAMIMMLCLVSDKVQIPSCTETPGYTPADTASGRTVFELSRDGAASWIEAADALVF
jgi:hypothetical protein